jgi:hypothetical protein
MKRCEFQGGTGLKEKYRPTSPCLNEFEPNSPNQKNCEICRPFARKAHNAIEAASKYRADPKKSAQKAREYRWNRRKAAGRQCRRIGSMQRCEYRDKRGKRSEECEIKYKVRSSAQRYCDPCRLRADADRAQDYRDKYPEKEKARQRARWKTMREQLAKIKAREFIPVRPIEEATMQKIRLSARLLREGLKPYQMTDQLYPPSAAFSQLSKKEKAADKAKRFDRLKKLLRYHQDRIDLEKLRTPPSPELSTEIHSLP